jgi:ABC-type lipoprotein release transport system permease subunit
VLLGVGAGAALLVILLVIHFDSDFQVRPEPGHLVGLMIYVALMPAVCMLACVVPLRRALRVQPTEALREDG